MAALLALALACGLLLFSGVGHGLHDDMQDARGTVAAGVGVCIVLFTLLLPLAVLPPASRRAVFLARVSSPVRAVLRLEPAPAARASPSWLQRFLN